MSAQLMIPDLGEPTLRLLPPTAAHAPQGSAGHETSAAAAAVIARDLPRLHALVLEAIGAARATGLSADQCAAQLGLSVLAVRPRVTELAQAGLVERSGRRVKNASGQSANVWVATAPAIATGGGPR